MIKINKCHNSENMNCKGLDISVEGMLIRISSGEINRMGEKILIDEHEINIEIFSEDRMIYIFLIKDQDNPIMCIEEIGKGSDEIIPNLIDTIFRTKIPANCTDLTTLDIDVWQYLDMPDNKGA
jgi:hypothetical protein